MLVIKRSEYDDIFDKMGLSVESKEKSIDVYHKNNWDRLNIHWDENGEKKCSSYIDFFFDAKSMVDFFRDFICKEDFQSCFVAPLYNNKYKLKMFDDDICKDIYDEFKILLNSLGLKVTTNCAISMDKEELVNWCDRLSIGGFCGVSEYSVIIPELNIFILPYHHMNYLIYSNEKKALVKRLLIKENPEIIIDY